MTDAQLPTDVITPLAPHRDQPTLAGSERRDYAARFSPSEVVMLRRYGQLPNGDIQPMPAAWPFEMLVRIALLNLRQVDIPVHGGERALVKYLCARPSMTIFGEWFPAVGTEGSDLPNGQPSDQLLLRQQLQLLGRIRFLRAQPSPQGQVWRVSRTGRMWIAEGLKRREAMRRVNRKLSVDECAEFMAAEDTPILEDILLEMTARGRKVQAPAGHTGLEFPAWPAAVPVQRATQDLGLWQGLLRSGVSGEFKQRSARARA